VPGTGPRPPCHRQITSSPARRADGARAGDPPGPRRRRGGRRRGGRRLLAAPGSTWAAPATPRGWGCSWGWRSPPASASAAWWAWAGSHPIRRRRHGRDHGRGHGHRPPRRGGDCASRWPLPASSSSSRRASRSECGWPPGASGAEGTPCRPCRPCPRRSGRRPTRRGRRGGRRPARSASRACSLPVAESPAALPSWPLRPPRHHPRWSGDCTDGGVDSGSRDG
jgi:hypothetical protein